MKGRDSVDVKGWALAPAGELVSVLGAYAIPSYYQTRLCIFVMFVAKARDFIRWNSDEISKNW